MEGVLFKFIPFIFLVPDNYYSSSCPPHSERFHRICFQGLCIAANTRFLGWGFPMLGCLKRQCHEIFEYFFYQTAFPWSQCILFRFQRKVLLPSVGYTGELILKRLEVCHSSQRDSSMRLFSSGFFMNQYYSITPKYFWKIFRFRGVFTKNVFFSWQSR